MIIQILSLYFKGKMPSKQEACVWFQVADYLLPTKQRSNYQILATIFVLFHQLLGRGLSDQVLTFRLFVRLTRLRVG